MKRRQENIPRGPARGRKAEEDTPAGCREYAAADLARASLMETTNGRRRLESSAQSWSNRADLLQQLDDGLEAQQALARTEWVDGEAEEGPANSLADPAS